MKFYITFGKNHFDNKGLSLDNCFTTIKAKNMREAREYMLKIMGNNWSRIYLKPRDFGMITYKVNYVPFNLVAGEVGQASPV